MKRLLGNKFRASIELSRAHMRPAFAAAHTSAIKSQIEHMFKRDILPECHSCPYMERTLERRPYSRENYGEGERYHMQAECKASRCPKELMIYERDTPQGLDIFFDECPPWSKVTNVEEGLDAAVDFETNESKYDNFGSW